MDVADFLDPVLKKFLESKRMEASKLIAGTPDARKGHDK